MTSTISVIAYKKGFKWKDATRISFEDYTITETDFRTKTAKFKSPTRLAMGGYSYAVKIASDKHETFTGIILKKDMGSNDQLYEYTCQDWGRLYQDKLDLKMNDTVYKIIKKIIKQSGGSKKGLLSIDKYEQGKYGSPTSFNPMKNKRNIELKHNKTSIEAIKSLIYSQHPYIDIHYNDRGRINFTPYHIDEWLKPVAEIDNIISYDSNLDHTNMLTNVGGYTYNKLFNNKYNNLYGFVNIYSNVDEPSKTSTSSSNNSDKTNGKTANTGKNGNPYGTKKKTVWVGMDHGGSWDGSYYNAFCKEAEKLGWKVHKCGIGPGTLQAHVNLPKNAKDGVYLGIVNGVDCEVFREFAYAKYDKGFMVKRGIRGVLLMMNDAGDIRKGGRYYKYLGKAHDGKWNCAALKYPAGYLAECGVPFMYQFGHSKSDAKKAAKKFNAGGDSQIALNNPYDKYGEVFKNWNWSSKY